MHKIEEKPKYTLKMKIKVGARTVSLNNKKSKLLQYIDIYGSIKKASEKIDISYRSAVKYIRLMEIELDSPILITKRGGKGGGGSSKLTDEGKHVLFEFTKINKVLKKHRDLNEMEGIISNIDKEKKIMKVDLNRKEMILPVINGFNAGNNILVSVSPINTFVVHEPHKSRVKNMFEGIITKMLFNDDAVRLNVNVDGNNMIVDVTEFPRKKQDLNIGKKIFIGFNAASADITKII